MAGFQTHITISTLCGAAYGYAGCTFMGFSTESSLLAAGLCSIAGMFPDLDSDSGVPARETLGFASAVIPMLLMQRWMSQGMSHEKIVLYSAALYLLVRFGLGELLKRITVHRGMFHSIPAACIAGMITFLLIDQGTMELKLYKSFAVVVGYISHLVLDEFWSVQIGWSGPKVKKSFGSAMKLFGQNATANFATFGLFILLGLIVVRDIHPGWMNEQIRQTTNRQNEPLRFK